MKKFNKIMSLILALAMIISMCPVLNLTAFAAENVTFSLEQSEVTVKPGESFTLAVDASELVDMYWVEAYLVYDRSILNLTEAAIGKDVNTDVGPGIDHYEYNAYEWCALLYTDTEECFSDVSRNGQIMLLTFTVASDAAVGSYGINFNFLYYDSKDNYLNGNDGNSITANVTVAAEEEPTVAKYAVTIGETSNGSVTADVTEAEAGTTVTLTATPSEGYELSALTVTDAEGNEVTVTDNAFTMPASNVTVTAAFAAVEAAKYTVTVGETANGTVTADVTEAAEGATVTLTVSPAEGYKLEALTVTDAEGNEVRVTDNAFTMLASNVTVSATFADSLLHGGETLTEGGEYRLATDATGIITIETTEAITIIGNGVEYGEDYKVTSTPCNSLSFDCTVAGVDLTIKDVYINGNSTLGTIIDLMGTGNKLNIEGTNLLDNASNTIHVPTDADVTIDGSGVLYLYKSSLASGIGGLNGETNGHIIINGGTIFAKGSSTGAVIGAGQGAGGGAITINGGSLYAMGKARGAVIGGSGYSGGNVGLGGAVTINGGSVMLVVDWSGAAVGGGGGNNSAAEQSGGTLVITGGSLKSRVNSNAYSTWGLEDNGEAYQISTVTITAEMLNADGEAGEAVYCLTLPLTGVTANASGDKYVVQIDGKNFYSGNGYTNTYYLSNAGTIENWPVGDPENCLYLFTTGETHKVTVNGVDYYYYFDPATASFTLGDAPSGVSYTVTAEETEGVTVNLSAAEAVKGDVVTIDPVCDNGYELVSLQWKLAEGADDSWADVTVLNGAYLLSMPEGNVVIKAAVKTIPKNDENGAYLIETLDDLLWFAKKVNSGSNSIDAKLVNDIDASSMEWNPIGTSTSTYAGTFDGNGKTITIAIGSEVTPTVAGQNGTLALFGKTDSATIKDLTVDGAIWGDASYMAGIVAYSTGTSYILNCTNKVNVTSTRGSTCYAGGIVGYTGNYLEIGYCVNYGAITNTGAQSTSRTGGIQGYDYYNQYGSGTQEVRIYDCVNFGAVTSGNGYAGGITAAHGTNYPIVRCVNNGAVSTTSTSSGYVGGIIGSASGDIVECVNTGSVSAPCNVGGIAGESRSNVTNCYNTGSVTGAGLYGFMWTTGGIVGRGNNGAIVTNCYNVGDVSPIEEEDVDGLVGNAGSYAPANSYSIDSVPTSNGVNLSAEAMKLNSFVGILGDAYRIDSENINNGYPILAFQGGSAYSGYQWYDLGELTGEYIIDTAEELLQFEQIVNGTDENYDLDSFAGKTVTLGADIDLSTVCGAELGSWEPIGGEIEKISLEITSQEHLDELLETYILIYDTDGVAYKKGAGADKQKPWSADASYYYISGKIFSGTFDGNGKTISNLYINTDECYLGLFGNVNGTVKNLTLNGSITCTGKQTDYVGSVAGLLSEYGVVERCVSYVTINAQDIYNVGGIVGCVGTKGQFDSRDNTFVLECVNYGDVTAYQAVGGIAGHNAGQIQRCANYGTIQAVKSGSKSGVGGIVGRNGENNSASDSGTILDCYNAGTVGLSGRKWQGGITGFNPAESVIKNCYSVGTIVSGAGQTNALIGQNEGYAENSWCLNTTIVNDANGIYNAGGSSVDCGALTEEEMKNAVFAAILGESYNVDDGNTVIGSANGYNAEDEAPAGYPVLAWMGGTEAPTLYTVTLPDSDETFVISTEDSTTVAEGGSFSFKVYIESGYTINYVKANDTELTADGSTYIIENITSDVTVSVSVSKNYTITVNAAENGTVAADASEAKAGETITLTVTADEGYELKTLTVTDAEGNEVTVTDNAFTMPTSDVTVCATFAEKVTYPWYEAGAETGSYTITTAEEMVQFAAIVNGTDAVYAKDGFSGKTVAMGADIDLSKLDSWTPIGTETAPFQGTFDGQNHKVNLYYKDNTVDSELFFAVKGAIIKNVVTTATDVACRTALVAVATSSRIENCVNHADIVAKKAGIQGYAAGMVYICSYDSSVTTLAEEDCGIFDCTNYGDVTCLYLGSYYEYIGKPQGRAAGISFNANRMVRCANYGNVIGGSTSESTAKAYALGYATEVIECFNAGTLTAGNYYHSAAIAGETITDCYNIGEVIYDPDTGGEQSITNCVDAIAGTTVTNCYNIGKLSSTVTNSKVAVNMQEIYATTVANCYTSADTFTPADLNGETGTAWNADTDNINNGYPILAWQGGSPYVEPTTYTVTLPEGGEGYTVEAITESTTVEEGGEFQFTVTADDGCQIDTVKAGTTELTADENGVYTITVTGNVEITVTASEKVPVPHSVTVAAVEGGTVTADVSEAMAGDFVSLTVTADDDTTLMSLTVTDADGKQVEVFEDNTFVMPDSDVTVIADFLLHGGETLTAGGNYKLATDATGVITIATTEKVTISGHGAQWEQDSTSGAYGAVTSPANEDMEIICSVPGVTLTLKDVYLWNNFVEHNLIDFTGTGNTLIFDGTVVLDHDCNAQGYASIHVPSDASLHIYGTTGSRAYLYKREQAAGIGGNYYEAGGEITFGIEGGANDFYFFMKGSKQGAVIGNGANCEEVPGNITFNSGIYNFIGVARGAIISGSAGASSKAAGNVFVNGGLLNFNVDYSGAAIGGGGYADGNDKEGGLLYVAGGSIRVYIDSNAADNGMWSAYGVTEAGVNDAAITAGRVNADGSEDVYLMVVDTSDMTASTYSIAVDGSTYYTGPRYGYCYYLENTNRDTDGDGQADLSTAPNGTPGNWISLDEPCFYLYVTGENHIVTVNGTPARYVWDEETKTFTVEEIITYTVTLPEDGEGYTIDAITESTTVEEGGEFQFTVTADDGYQIDTVKAGTTELTADENGVYTITVTEDVTIEITAKAVEYDVVLGDVNLDGKVDQSDVALLFAYVMEEETLTKQQLANGDVNADGVDDNSDVTKLLSYVLGQLASLQ